MTTRKLIISWITFLGVLVLLGLYFFFKENDVINDIYAQKIEVMGEVYYTDNEPKSPNFGKEMVVYATQGLTVDLNREIIDSNTEKVGENKYKIYGGVPQFYNATNYWSEIEYEYLDKESYDGIYKTVKIVPFIQTAMAQTFYPSVDGKLLYTNTNYTTVNDNTLGTPTANTTHDTVVGQLKSGADYYIYRGRIYFNTSSLNDTDTVSSASISLYDDGNTVLTGDNTWTVGIYAGTTDNTGALEADDYNKANIGSTVFGSKVMTSWSQGDHNVNTFSLNANGLSYISKTGVTTFAFRSSKDISSTAPTGSEYAQVYFSEETGTNYDPVLIVEVTAGSGGSTLSYASGSYEDLDISSGVIYRTLILFCLGFIFPVWYFNKKRNDRIIRL